MTGVLFKEIAAQKIVNKILLGCFAKLVMSSYHVIPSPYSPPSLWDSFESDLD